MANTNTTQPKSTSASTSPRASRSKGATSMAELMAAQLHPINTLKKGDFVEGTIKKLTPREILLDIGYKSDALVIEFDKSNLENLLALLKVGDKVTASVISAESEDGFPVVSLRRTLDDMVYSKFESLYKNQESLQVSISDSTKGGYFAEAEGGVKGFVPNSQMLDGNEVVGRTIDVKVIEFDKSRKRIIFSQKATSYTTDPVEMEKYIKKDALVEGKVTSVTPYGLYVVINPNDKISIEGFIHISEISYSRVSNLEQMYKKDQMLKAQIIDFDKESRRVNLSVKRLERDNFDQEAQKYKKDQKIKGKITDVKTRGVTVELEPGILGFIQSSKIPTHTTYIIGDKIEAEVSEIDMKKRLIMLTPVLKAIPMGYR